MRRALSVMEYGQHSLAGPATERLDEPLLTAAQVAELLVVPVSSVYEYARRFRDPLPSIAIGRHRRFDRGDLAAWLMRQRTLRP